MNHFFEINFSITDHFFYHFLSSFSIFSSFRMERITFLNHSAPRLIGISRKVGCGNLINKESDGVSTNYQLQPVQLPVPAAAPT